MKKALILCVLLSFGFQSDTTDPVYICVSKTASKYHLNQDCHGLKNCKHEIKSISKSEAIKLGYSLCGHED